MGHRFSIGMGVCIPSCFTESMGFLKAFLMFRTVPKRVTIKCKWIGIDFNRMNDMAARLTNYLGSINPERKERLRARGGGKKLDRS